MCAGLQPEHVRVSGNVICELLSLCCTASHLTLMFCCPDKYFVLLKDESCEQRPLEAPDEVMEEALEERTV